MSDDELKANIGLGRGLDSLIPAGAEDSPSSQNEISVNLIDVNPHQPRTSFNEEELSELSASIKKHGVLQPLIVTKSNDHYELIAGERRLRAAKMAGLKTVPVIERTASDHEKLEMALIENVHRADLNPIDEAISYRKLVEEFSYSQDQVAEAVGKSRATVANKIRLLGLSTEIKKAIRENKISEGHAKALLSIENEKDRLSLFEKILQEGINVREVEKRAVVKKEKTGKEQTEDDLMIKHLADDLKNFLGTKVKLKKSSRGGKIEISYYSSEELARIYQKIKGVD